jgi:Complex I intermediate-associated protein 30 (CIA30)
MVAVFMFLCAAMVSAAVIAVDGAFAPSAWYPATRSLSHSTSLESSKDSRSEKDRRYPWDFFRFVSQSSKFIDPTVVPTLPFLPSPFSPTPVKVAPKTVLWTSVADKTVRDTLKFAPLDDVVMGGASSSTFDGTTGIWRGYATDANNGGFMGMRSTPLRNPLDLSACQGLQFQLRVLPPPTDSGKLPKSIRLKVVLRDSTDFNGITWTAIVTLDPAAPLNTVNVPLTSLVPALFARKVTTPQKFQSNRVAGVQLVYSKFEFDGEINPTFQVGDFGLQLVQIDTY